MSKEYEIVVLQSPVGEHKQRLKFFLSFFILIGITRKNMDPLAETVTATTSIRIARATTATINNHRNQNISKSANPATASTTTPKQH